MRKTFADLLLKEMDSNESIYVISGDLGYKMWDQIREKHPKRFINPMAAELTAMGMCVGMTYNNIIPVFFSITNFAIFRPYELIRNYVDYENVPVKIVCSGRGEDYANQGITHKSNDAKYVLDGFKNIKQYWPETKEEINEDFIKGFLYNNKPCFLSLRR